MKQNNKQERFKKTLLSLNTTSIYTSLLIFTDRFTVDRLIHRALFISKPYKENMDGTSYENFQ